MWLLHHDRALDWSSMYVSSMRSSKLSFSARSLCIKVRACRYRQHKNAMHVATHDSDDKSSGSSDCGRQRCSLPPMTCSQLDARWCVATNSLTSGISRLDRCKLWNSLAVATRKRGRLVGLIVCRGGVMKNRTGCVLQTGRLLHAQWRWPAQALRRSAVSPALLTRCSSDTTSELTRPPYTDARKYAIDYFKPQA